MPKDKITIEKAEAIEQMADAIYFDNQGINGGYTFTKCKQFATAAYDRLEEQFHINITRKNPL